MSYRRIRRQPEIAEFEVLSLVSGKPVAFAEDIEHVQELAEQYLANPELIFIAIDTSGHEVGSWTAPEILDGSFLRQIA